MSFSAPSHRPPPAPTPTEGAPCRRRGGALLTALVVLPVLALGGVIAWHLHGRHVAADAQRFEVLTSRLHDEILRRVKLYRYGLNGTRSAFAARESLSRAEFRTAFEVRDFEEEFPAARNMGYIERVPAAGLDDFLADVQADGAPDFSVRMLADQIEHEDLFVVRYVEPVELNRGVLGLDIGQGARRRAAAEYAMRTGDVAITEPIQLALGPVGRPGFLILLPSYRSGVALNNATQREAALDGWVYMAIQPERLFAGAGALVNGELDFRVFDSEEPTPEQMLYESQAQGDEAQADPPRHCNLVTVSIGGRAWRVDISSTPRFRAAPTRDVWTAAGGGLLLAALLGLLLQSQSTSLDRAQALARKMTADLRRIALTDRLTGLPNRVAVIPMIQEAIDHARRTPDHRYAVLFVDLDRFKAVNDSVGQGAGDELLVAIAARLRDAVTAAREAGGLGTRSVVARLGGDEFVVLLDGLTGLDSGTTLADRLREELGETCRISGREVRVDASIGLVHHAAAYFSAEEVVRDADTAMYEAKNRGSGRCVVFDISMRTRITDRLRIENDLSGAIGRGEFFLEYQPIVSLSTGAVETCEALVRWRHPELGVLSPDTFVGVAEENGMIVPLGAWVLEESLAQLARWRREPSLPGGASVPGVSVNLSRKQLLMPDLPMQVFEAMARHGADASGLQLEVTESQIMENRGVAIGCLRRLREAGVRIAIDDFGTGHSSLACLHAFPTDVLKIDRAFVANLDRDLNLVALLRSVTEMARTLGKRVVAEGIETDAQHHLLSELACDMGQGYRFSRPLAPEHVLSFCAQRISMEVA